MDGLHVEIENVPLREFSVKGGDFVMIIMYNYGTNERVGDKKFRTISGVLITFNYPETVHRHYQHRDAVVLHNENFQGIIALEETSHTRG